jgi:hypothetical protein
MPKNDRQKDRGNMLDIARIFLGYEKVTDLPTDLIYRIEYAASFLSADVSIDRYALVLAIVTEWRFNRPPDVLMQAVDSSNIKSVGYDSIRHELHIAFHNGRTYRYARVPETEYRKLLEADSVGKAFTARIKKGGYSYEQITETTPAGQDRN